MADETSFLAPGPLPLIGPDFHIVGAVGRVGDGLVYAARDSMRPARLREYCPPGVVRRVADGTLHPADARLAAAWQDSATRFLEQGHRLASIDHFKVGQVWRAMSIESDGVRQGAYLIGAAVGETLGAALAGGLQLPPERVLRIADDLADALAELHARGLTHLDISPATVSIAAGFIELFDFAVDNRPFMALLESQDGLVRPGYSPIEHYDASMAEPLGPPADVYAGSALLFRLITGRDPAPWQERWRDPGDTQLANAHSYPPAFIEAVRRGLSIEPEDRYRDAAEWHSAMGFPSVDPLRRTLPATLDRSVTVPFDPADVPPNAATAAAPIRLDPVSTTATPRHPVWAWLLPLLFVLLLAAIAIGGYVAYQQRWFVPDEPIAEDVEIAPRPAPSSRPARERTPPSPLVEVGGTVAGELTAADVRRAGGSPEDRFTLRGRAGDRLELRLSSGDFDPLLRVSGSGVTASNDDDPTRSTDDSRVQLTIPRDATYTIFVTGADSPATGLYFLEVARAPEAEREVVTLDLGLVARLNGQWHALDDLTCERPAVNAVRGEELVSRIEGDTYRHRIVQTQGNTIRTIVLDGRLAGRSFEFRLDGEGDSYVIDRETWIRC